MKILIVGYGSIGKRHARILRPMASTLGIVTAQEAMDYPLFRSIEDAFDAGAWDYVVICTITSQHAENLEVLRRCGFTGKVLVEKPVFMHVAENAGSYPFRVYAGYHLRFHKIIAALQNAIKDSEIHTARAHVGQHLSLWRPGRDPKDTYSAHIDQGGGVMRDLSHELDLAQFLFGEIIEYEGKAERLDDVTVDSEDTATFKLQCKRCENVIVHMNYTDEVPTREWFIETDKGTVTADLIRRSITVNETTHVITCESDAAYTAMHQAVLGDQEGLCDLNAALAILKVIDDVPFQSHIDTEKNSKSA